MQGNESVIQFKLRLCYMWNFHLGHNDVTSSAWVAADGPDRGVGAVVVAMFVRAFAGHQMIRPWRSTTFTKQSSHPFQVYHQIHESQHDSPLLCEPESAGLISKKACPNISIPCSIAPFHVGDNLDRNTGTGARVVVLK
jgi:hypothetical protein